MKDRGREGGGGYGERGRWWGRKEKWWAGEGREGGRDGGLWGVWVGVLEVCREGGGGVVAVVRKG